MDPAEKAKLQREIHELTQKKRKLLEDVAAIDKFIKRRIDRIAALSNDEASRRGSVIFSWRVAKRWMVGKDV